MIKLRFTQKCFHWSTLEWTYIPCWKARWILCEKMKRVKCWWQLIFFVFKSSGSDYCWTCFPHWVHRCFCPRGLKNIILFTARQHLYFGTARTGQLWSRTVALICRNAVLSTHNMAPQFMNKCPQLFNFSACKMLRHQTLFSQYCVIWRLAGFLR